VTNNSTAYFSGTSMAAPLVAGSAALVLRASNFTLSALDLKQLLMATAEPLPSLEGKVTTGGILRVDKAMAFAEQASAAPAPLVVAMAGAPQPAGEGPKRRGGRKLRQS
jgi:subtilisin family serine protease